MDKCSHDLEVITGCPLCRIKQLEALLRRALKAKQWTSSHPFFNQLYDEIQKELEGKDG